MQPKGSTFDQELFRNYVALSRADYEGGGYASSDRWAKEAAMVANGQTPKPTQVSDWKLPAALVPEMTTARQRLQTVLDKGGPTIAPIETARAQVAWDCWCEKQQVSENFQTEAIANCRKLFYENLAKAETAVAPKPAAVKTEAVNDYLVFFDWNKATLTPEARRIVADAVTYARSSNAKMIRVVGYTDRSGTPKYNIGLSVRRAEAVREEIKRLDMPAATIEVEGKGEQDPLVPTPDRRPRAAEQARRDLFRENGREPGSEHGFYGGRLPRRRSLSRGNRPASRALPFGSVRSLHVPRANRSAHIPRKRLGRQLAAATMYAGAGRNDDRKLLLNFLRPARLRCLRERR